LSWFNVAHDLGQRTFGSYTLVELSKGAATEPAAGRGQRNRYRSNRDPGYVERPTSASVQETAKAPISQT
jgi:hypothetical protein